MALASTIKRYLMFSALMIELIFFAALYVAGSHGVYALRALDVETRDLMADIALLQKDVQTLETTLHAWQNHPFYKEKMAREQLQMARADDTVYYLS